MAQQLSTNTFGVSKWIVSSTLSNGTHTTIAAALTSASSGDTIFIRPGSYTEDLTLKAGVNLCAFTGDQNQANVIITGKLTASFSGICSISNIDFITNSDFSLSLTGANSTLVNCYNCFFNGLNSSIFNSSGSNGASGITLFQCSGNLATTGIKLINSSNGGHNFYQSVFANSGASTTASTISAGTLGLINCILSAPITTSSTGVVNTKYTSIDTSAQNVACLTVGGGTSGSMYSSYVSGSASAISISSTFNSGGDTVGSTNTNPVTGAGTLNYTPIKFTSTGVAVNVTTQTPLSTGPGGIKGLIVGTPAAGFIGEQIRSAVASGSAITFTNPTAANITSISLTAGIWDVTGVVMFNGAVTGVATGASIGTVSATIGTQGDNYVTTPFQSTTIDLGITVPPYRISLTSTTTVYLVGISLFTVGTSKGYGRISATRVG